MPLIFLHAGLGAFLLTGWRGNFFFLCLTLCLAWLQWEPKLPNAVRFGPTPRSILFLSYLLVAFVTWRLTAWFAQTLVVLQGHIGMLQDRKTRMDRLRAVGALASGFSHEFATPLNTVKMRLERLGRKAVSHDNVDLCAAIEAVDQCETALRSFNDSRVQSDSLSLAPVRLTKTVEAIVETWKKEHSQVIIDYHNTLGGDDYLALPRAAFSQIILNLLDNAFESGSSTPHFEIEFLQEGEALCFRLTDNGGGIPPVVFRQWGEPFVTTKPLGTGLGLFNALSLAQALGGDFKVRNLKSGGACVEFCLPRLEPKQTSSIEFARA